MKIMGCFTVMAALGVIGLTGCAGNVPSVRSGELPGSPLQTLYGGEDRQTAPSAVETAPEESVVPFRKGSLWPGANTQNMYFADNKAHTVNDIVTIEIVESSTASKEATTKLGRSSDISATATGAFGLETKLNARLARIQGSNAAGTSNSAALDLANILKATTQNDFDGSGVTTRSGKLSGRMTGLVEGVLPNGNLRIQGKRMVTVNGEEQIMVLTGVIRPEDISSNNVVLSTYIADARIQYFGMGVISEKQYPGWMARMFDRVWPF